MFEDSGDAGPLSGLIKINSEESDPEFDDVEVDLSQLRKPAASASSASAVEESNKVLVDKYGMAVGFGGAFDIKTLHARQVRVNTAAENLRNSPTPENNKEYKKALLDMLNLRSWLIHNAHNNFVIPGDPKQDSLLESDPLLSVAELKLINASITPKHPLKGVVSSRKSYNRQSLPTWDGLLEEAKLIDEEAKTKPISGISDNWEYGSVEKIMLDAEAQLKTAVIDVGGLTDIVSRLGAFGKVKAYLGRGTVVLTDSSGRYSGNFIVNGRNGRRMATDSQINASIEALLASSDKIEMPGTPGAQGKYSFDIGFDVLLTTTQYEHEDSKTTSAEQGVQAYANPSRGVTVLIDRLTRTQETVDNGRVSGSHIDGSPSAMWSTKVEPNTNDALTHGVIHEVGHMVAFRALLSKNEMRGDGQAPSRYGRESEHENFAEYYARYMRTGDAPDWFMKILRQRNLLKSQQNN